MEMSTVAALREQALHDRLDAEVARLLNSAARQPQVTCWDFDVSGVEVTLSDDRLRGRAA